MNEQPFPIISENQVALLRDDLYTGHVMDKDIKIAINDKQETWTVFDEISQAMEEANRIVTEYDFIECFIFDKDKNLIEHITPL